MTSGEPPIPTGTEIAPGVRVDPALLRFSAVRSSGPGGQNVNKVATKAELRIEIGAIPISQAARARLVSLASHLVTDAGELIITSDDSRSLRANKDDCLRRLRELIVRAKVPPKPRKKTKPTLGSKKRRLQAKKERGEIKKLRKPPGRDD